MLRVFGFWLVMTVAAVAQSGDIDPVGTYEFSTFANNQTLTGTITISKIETGWSALFESPSGQLPPMTTTSVKVEGKNVTLTIPFGDVGEILIEITLDGDDLTGRWVLGMDSGELTGKRINQ